MKNAVRVSEAFLLLNPWAESRDIAGYVLAELTGLGVFDIQIVHRSPHKNDPATVRYDLLKPGKALDTYLPRGAQSTLFPETYPRRLFRI